MGEIIYGDIKQYIDELAQSLGVAAEHVYGLLVRQQVIEGVTSIIVKLLVIAGIIGLSLYLRNIRKKAEWRTTERKWSWGEVDIRKYPENKYAEFLDSGVVVPVIVGMVIISAGIILTLSGDVNRLINPEYYAIREIMDVFKGGE